MHCHSSIFGWCRNFLLQGLIASMIFAHSIDHIPRTQNSFLVATNKVSLSMYHHLWRYSVPPSLCGRVWHPGATEALGGTMAVIDIRSLY
ncbi:hypothetical protein JB92DRAFT_2919773 [Gautieria morchelliformis]|nr:hypothetical protein JB92DRAFT_2919773 [Gautieria morchelliformis]